MIGVLYLILESKGIYTSNCKLYYSIVYSITMSFLAIGGYMTNSYANPKVLRSINKDSEIEKKVREISSILRGKHTVLNSSKDVLNELGYYQQEIISSGKIKYTKLNDQEFTLEYELQTDKEDISKIKRLKHICNNAATFLDEKYYKGIHIKTFKIQK
jgi:hypothetical protein